MAMEKKCPPERISTGVTGLDEILMGGLLPNRGYLVRGGPGTGKTTLSLQFLAEGLRRGEKGIFISLSEKETILRPIAERLSPELKDLSILDLSPTSEYFSEAQTYSLFSPSDVERKPFTNQIVQRLEEERPKRVVIDAMTQLRYLSPDVFQYRKQVLSFLYFLLDRNITVMLISESSQANPDDELQFLSQGIITLEIRPDGLRYLRVGKLYGSDFRTGPHLMKLSANGMEVFPRLIPETHGRAFISEPIPSGLPELDAILHGGLERGTITILTGPSGTGKTSLGMQFLAESTKNGERSVMYSFEEEPGVSLLRADNLKIPARSLIERDLLSLVKIEPLQYAPEEFANLVRQEVERQESRFVMIDSTAGYQLSMRGQNLVPHLHALCKYLQNMGVATLLINEKEELSGYNTLTDYGISYMADNIIILEYFQLFLEDHFELRKALGVIKKRLSGFERSLHEIEVTPSGLKVHPALRDLNFIIRGMPTSKPCEVDEP